MRCQIPIFLSELSPPAFRATFGGLAYQLGNVRLSITWHVLRCLTAVPSVGQMISSASAQIEASLSHALVALDHTYVSQPVVTTFGQRYTGWMFLIMLRSVFTPLHPAEAYASIGPRHFHRHRPCVHNHPCDCWPRVCRNFIDKRFLHVSNGHVLETTARTSRSTSWPSRTEEGATTLTLQLWLMVAIPQKRRTTLRLPTRRRYDKHLCVCFETTAPRRGIE